jgi:poly(3-hydroxybutyrate) depolymerase
LKRRTAVALASVLAACAAGLVLVARLGSSAAIELHRDLVFSTAAGTPLKLDLARPRAGPGPFPAIVFLFGGGWRDGDRRQMRHFVEGTARLGYVGVAPDYRLVPGARFPAQLEDAKAAIRWLRAHAEQYGVRADRIGVVGFSAGGHLAAMLGLTRAQDGFEGAGGPAEPSSQVQAVVSFFGPTDFSTRDWPADLEREVIVPFLGGSGPTGPRRTARRHRSAMRAPRPRPFSSFTAATTGSFRSTSRGGSPTG